MRARDLDTFFAAYVEAALFSSTDESTPQGGEPLDKNYTGGDLSPACRAVMRRDCERFARANQDDIVSAKRNAGATYSAWEHAGHDFWFTRMGHGCGFDDGDWSEPHAARLAKAARAFGGAHGEAGLYVEEGVIHAFNEHEAEGS